MVNPTCTRTKTFKKRKWCRDAAYWWTKHRNKLHVGTNAITEAVWWNLNHTAIPDPTSVNQTAIPYISSFPILLILLLATDVGARIAVWFTDVGSGIAVWFKFHQIKSHRFSDSIDPYMQLVSVLCSPVSSIPTSLSFFKSFCPCFHPFFILHIVQAHAQLHKQTKLIMECAIISSLCGIAVWFNSFLEKSGCSQARAHK